MAENLECHMDSYFNISLVLQLYADTCLHIFFFKSRNQKI